MVVYIDALFLFYW